MKKSPKYLILNDILPERISNDLYAFIESEQNWKLHEEWFFSQYDTAWVRRNFDRPPLGELTESMKRLMCFGSELIEKEFNAVLGANHTVIGHKMTAGQLVGIHNDSPDHDRGRLENYRLIYYFDKSFEDSKGGHLLLFGSETENDVIDAVRPIFNSAVLLELSDASFHAVNKIKQGERLCMVISYWGYPILFSDNLNAGRVRSCLNKIIALGLEGVEHSKTTFSYHLYHTFRILFFWKQDIDVCLAGLTHSLLGREVSNIHVSLLSAEDLFQLVGERAFKLVTAISYQSGFKPVEEVDDRDIHALYLIELANLIEQSESHDDITMIEARAQQIPNLTSDLAFLVNEEIAHKRSVIAIKSASTTVKNKT
jgi:hypothetical protein